MTTLRARHLAGFFLAATLFAACKHTDDPMAALVVTSTTDLSVAPTLVPQTYLPAAPTRSQPEYVFDWERATTLPNPASSAPVPMPWRDEAVRMFSDDIRYDYKKADGWELVLSNSTSQYVPDHRVLMLYNRYRGLLRTYYYLTGNWSGLVGNNMMTYGLAVSGSSPLLTYAAQSVTDVTVNSPFVAATDAQPIQAGAWYAFQDVLAYDPTLRQQRFANVSLSYTIQSNQLGTLRVDQQTATQLPGKLTIDGSDLTRFANPASGAGRFFVSGNRDIGRLQQSGLPVGRLGDQLAKTTTDGLLNAILLPANGTTSSVLEWTGTVQLTEVPQRSAGVASPIFALPGYDNSQISGVAPQFNEVPGVWYLAARPQIKTTTRASTEQPYVYTLDVPSVKYLFNPAVTQVAAIQDIRQEIIASATSQSAARTSGASTYYTGTTLSASQPLTIVGVRVSFSVVPKNGSAPVQIIKTFKADVNAS